jgi:hypothetical protein
MEKLIRINDNFLSVTYFKEPAEPEVGFCGSTEMTEVYASGNILELLEDPDILTLIKEKL